MTDDPTAGLRARFAATIGGGRPSPWREAFAAVPRHLFVPSFFRQDGRGEWRQVTAVDGGYAEAVYSDTALTTQLDAGGVPSSSSSEPSTMLAMLDALGAGSGQAVFELGTGTGYNAALLAHRVGAENVTSVDVDAGLVDLAVHRLGEYGTRPYVTAGDGALGCPERAPFDRIIATAALREIHPALLEQATVGAVIVAPIGSGIVRATVSEPGHAEGRFLPTPALFMPRRTPGMDPDFETLRQQTPERTTVPVADVLERLRFPLSLALPGYHSCSWRDTDGTVTAVGLWTDDGSTALATTTGQARQTGPHHLWSTVEHLASTFPTGSPPHEAFGITATPTGHHIWYGAPKSPVWKVRADAP
ncbi:methyltransferase domain-containing protein [Actinacidiphila bryophytorum]|uniref:methyltransferase domain-containing protein n=1 Tax=Actinacidiphila bryophytorum TaxID=1436133 RepID=UPI0021769E74|nr:methyltransferase domain-containing protein [Actinacidiphila bryophytorum]UWE07370.1 methyltransferase domain-containing protein [Actinacidiphila bryophytorum]